MKAWPLIILLLVLAGCANLFAPPNALTEAERARLTTQGRVFEIRAQFNAAQRAFQSYAAQPFCTEIRVVACADAAVVIRAQALTAEALGALEAAETAAQAGAGDAPAIAAAARVALARLSQFIITREELPP